MVGFLVHNTSIFPCFREVEYYVGPWSKTQKSTCMCLVQNDVANNKKLPNRKKSLDFVHVGVWCRALQTGHVSWTVLSKYCSFWTKIHILYTHIAHKTSIRNTQSIYQKYTSIIQKNTRIWMVLWSETHIFRDGVLVQIYMFSGGRILRWSMAKNTKNVLGMPSRNIVANNRNLPSSF